MWWDWIVGFFVLGQTLALIWQWITIKGLRDDLAYHEDWRARQAGRV